MKPAYIAPVSWGLGDLIVSLPAVQGLIAAGYETTLVTRSSLQEGLASRIDGLFGSVREEDLPGTEPGSAAFQAASTTYFNLRNHPLQTDHWWGSPEFEAAHGPLSINEILAAICQDLDIPANFSQLQPLLHGENPSTNGKILLLAGSDGPFKCWPTQNWIELQKRLAALGQEVVVLGQPENSAEVKALVDHGLHWIPTPTLADCVDAISSARAAVGIDTGLMHVAVQQGIATVALYRANPIYVRPYPHVKVLTAPECAQECIDKSLGIAINQMTDLADLSPGTWTCDITNRCMQSINVDEVLNALSQMLPLQLTAHREKS